MMKKLNVYEADMLASKFRLEVLGCGLADPIRVKAMLLKLNILTVYRPLSENFCGISLRSKDDERFMRLSLGQAQLAWATTLYNSTRDVSFVL